MPQPEWSDEQVEKCRSMWSACAEATGTEVFQELARLLSYPFEERVTPQMLRLVQTSSKREEMYKTVEIPKKRGGHRILSIPQKPIILIQRRLLEIFTSLFPRHQCAHGFERGKGIVSHAALHTKKKWVYCIDIRDFFPSINWGRVCGMVQVYPFESSSDVGRVLANAITFKGCLPQGAPTSPILSNLVCRKLDSRLFRWAGANGYTYSRYADDLTFSTNNAHFPSDDQAFIDQIVREEGFEVNPHKKRLMPAHTRQLVTGLVVNEKVNLPREYTRGLRALLHNVESYGWKSQVERQEWLFDDRDEYVEYRTQSLDADEFKRLDKKQGREHRLVNPNALMPDIHGLIGRARSDEENKSRDLYAHAIHKFKQKVLGRIEHVGHIKGREGTQGRLYQKLRSRFDFLSDFDDMVGERLGTVRKEILATNPGLRNRKGTYRKMVARFDGLQDTRLQWELNDVSDEILEFSWLMQERDPSEMMKAIRSIAYRASLSPKDAGHFFSHFNRSEGCFRGLLHSPDVVSREDTEELLKDAQAVLAAYKSHLRNTLRDDAENFLSKCKQRFGRRADWHPWTDNAFLHEHVLPFKKKTRFDDDDEATDLLDCIERTRAEVEGELSRSVGLKLPLVQERIFTHTPTVEKGISLITRSMLSNSQQDDIDLEVEIRQAKIGEADLHAMVVEFYEPGGEIRKRPELHSLFSGKLQGAVRYLRGYAHWKFSAPFPTGASYQFNVMSNDRTKSPEPLSGIRHTLTFYQ